MRRPLFDRVAVCAALLGLPASLVACSEDAPPPPTAAAGTGAAVSGTGAPAAGTGAPVAGMVGATAGTVGTMGNPVTGTAGTGTPVAGTGVAGTGVAGMAAVTAGTGAAGTGAGMAGTGAPAFTPGSPTFSAIYQEIIVAKGCNGGPTCHASTAAGQLKMTTKMEAYTSLVGVKAMGVNLVMNGTPNCKDSNLTRVVAGNPEMSLFFKKVNEAMPECGGKMPPAGEMLPPAMLNQIRMWIMNGAKDD